MKRPLDEIFASSASCWSEEERADAACWKIFQQQMADTESSSTHESFSTCQSSITMC
jgi:hypothetical protein